MKFRPAIAFVSAAGLAMMLGACGDDPAPVTGEGDLEASEDVIEGTISDEMIPLDQVRSQAPLAEPEAATGTDGPTGGEDQPAAEAGPQPEAGDEAVAVAETEESE